MSYPQGMVVLRDTPGVKEGPVTLLAHRHSGDHGCSRARYCLYGALPHVSHPCPGRAVVPNQKNLSPLTPVEGCLPGMTYE